jgi:hypothetical protein
MSRRTAAILSLVSVFSFFGLLVAWSCPAFTPHWWFHAYLPGDRSWYLEAEEYGHGFFIRHKHNYNQLDFDFFVPFWLAMAIALIPAAIASVFRRAGLVHKQ